MHTSNVTANSFDDDQDLLAAQLANDVAGLRAGHVGVEMDVDMDVDVDMVVEPTDVAEEAGVSSLRDSLAGYALQALGLHSDPLGGGDGMSLGAALSSHLHEASMDKSQDDNDDNDDNSEANKKETADEEDMSMLDRYAFNFHRTAYDHRVPHHLTTGIALNIAKVHPHHVTLAHHYHQRDASGADDDDMCPPLIRPPEIEPMLSGAAQCIWVGMLPRQAWQASSSTSHDIKSEDAVTAVDNTTTLPKKHSRKKALPMGPIVDLTEDSLTSAVVPHDDKALRVVAKKLNKSTHRLYLYALVVHPLGGGNSESFCHGYKVEKDDVYFFRAFRDDGARSAAPRKHETEKKIRAHLFPALPSPAPSGSPGPRLRESARVAAAVRVPASPANKVDVVGSKETDKTSATTPGDRVVSTAMRCVSEAGGPTQLGHQDSREGRNQNDIVDIVLDSDDDEDEDDHTFVMVQRQHGQADLGRSQAASTLATTATYPLKSSRRNALEAKSVKKQIAFCTTSKGASGSPVKSLPPKHRSVSYLPSNEDCKRSEPHGEPMQIDRTDDGRHLDQSRRRRRHHQEAKNGVLPNNNSRDRIKTRRLRRKIAEVVDRMAADRDIAGLEQALVLLESLEDGSRPPASSVLGLYLNVPAEGDETSRIDIANLMVGPLNIYTHI